LIIFVVLALGNSSSRRCSIFLFILILIRTTIVIVFVVLILDLICLIFSIIHGSKFAGAKRCISFVNDKIVIRFRGKSDEIVLIMLDCSEGAHAVRTLYALRANACEKIDHSMMLREVVQIRVNLSNEAEWRAAFLTLKLVL
jgi:hypothetical protein